MAKRKKRTKTRRSRKSRRVKFFSFLKRTFYWALVAAIWMALILGCYIGYVVMKMPQISQWDVPSRPPNIRIVDRSGQLIANRGQTGGQAVPLNEMSPYLPKAVIAIEDRRFYSHFGIDPIGLTRAALTNLLHTANRQGGSTITQQLAKNLFLTPERTFERKIQEALLALWLEHKYTKDQIMSLYLNRVYLGSGAYGVEAASQRYFNKSARQLNLLEAATLAGLLKAPSRYSPANNRDGAIKRAHTVLMAMREEGQISQKELEQALQQTLKIEPSHLINPENYVADEVMAQLPFLIGQADHDIIVHTTIDLNLQRLGARLIEAEIAQNKKSLNVHQGALVSIDRSGGIRAIIGGANYQQSQYNRAIEAKRQPGSTFKPFVYLAAMEAGLTPNSRRNDAPVKIGPWQPHNFGNKYMGDVSLATALSHSLNSVAAQLIMEVGPQNVINVAHKMGIHSGLSDNASIALGTSEVSLLELTGAYVPFANGGYRPQIRLITSITNTDNKTLYDFGPVTGERIIAPDIVAMMNAMLEQTVADGTAKRADIGRPQAGKTGTSQDSRDAWFIGYTADFVTGVWFGNDDGNPMKNVFGSTLPIKIWKPFMLEAEQNLPVSALYDDFKIDDSLKGEEPTQKPRTILDILRGL